MKRIITTSLLLISLISTAQLRIGLETNHQYYIDDEKIKLKPEEAENRYRSNSYLKLNYTISDFEFSLQMESYAPKALISYNSKLKDQHIGIVFARYKNFEDGVDVTLGHMYEQFGSGLALRFWEDRTLGINNALFGSRIVYNMEDVVQLKILGGKQRVGMGFDFSDGLVYGADTEVNVSEIANLGGNDLKFGLTFVGRADDATHVKRYKNLPINTFVYGGRIDFLGDKFNFSAEFLQKSEDAPIGPNPASTPKEYIGTINSNFMKKGNAFLVNLGYNSGNFSSNINLRRLENFNFYSQRNLQGNTYNYGMINYIPSLTKQYEHSLQNIYVCQPYPSIKTGEEDGSYKSQIGDIGGQFDVFYEAPEGSFLGGKTGANFAINGSYWAHLPAKSKIENYIVLDIEGANFFSLGERYYSDIGFEYRKRFSSRFNGIFSYLNQFYLKTDVVTHTISVDGTYQITDEQSIRLELQHQFADADYKNWAGGLLEYTPTPSFSLFVQDLYNYGNDFEDKRLHYYTGGCSYTQGATRLAISYGRQRGGTMCTGGVCRPVPESNGFTVNLTTSF